MNSNVMVKQESKPGQSAEFGEGSSQFERRYLRSFGMVAPLTLRVVSSPRRLAGCVAIGALFSLSPSNGERVGVRVFMVRGRLYQPTVMGTTSPVLSGLSPVY
jgi:hypothetical protein